ncbi:hypothetical protein A3Q56_05554 [Intoshia linei]|uniref:Cyclic nucleotide-binding domain-containing protein n=1 Tax=Intoshia linei TaxID=1819745 RepID=A0A177AXI4_9BILA|nr:hypothetical protein A3Q56_05554 [Intoshia linei]
MIITLVLLTIIPIELSLIRNTGIFTINVIIDFLFLLLIIFTKFNMAYYNEENELIIHPIYTAKNYLNNNFISDFVSIIPFELFVLYNDDYGVNNYLLILVVFRYIRLLRFHKAIKSLKSIVKDNSNLLTHVLLIFYVLIFIHIITCFIIHNSCFFADQMNSENSQQICNYGSWISNKVVDLGINNNWSVYSLAMYWTTATVTTVGYGDIIGKLDNELIFSIILMILGTMFIGHIMANEASLIVNLDNERSEYCAKSLILKDFMTYHLFPKKLIKNALDYYIYVWKRSKYANYQSIFQGFPNSMMDDLALNLYRDNLKRISIFQNADECILKTLSKICSIEFYPKNEYIVENSHITENIYFIFRGSVQISRFKSDDKTLQIGEFFGKLSGRAFKKNLFSAMAMEDCDLFVLSQDKLHFIKDYIDMENFLNENCVNELSKQIIFIKSHIAYRDDGGILITDIRKIFYNYLTQPSVIIVDILPIINWEFLVCFYQYYHQLKILSYVKLVRIVRIFRVIATFKNLEQRVDVNTIYITIFKLTIYIAILAHVICCLWYWISCPVGECYPISWVNYHELESKGFRKFYAYSIALYWSFTTITTIGFGNIHAVNTTERLMSVFTMIMAKVVLTYVFSTLDSAISNNNVLHLNFTNKVFAIKNTLKNAKVDEELISLSLNHMEYKWNYIKNVSLVELISPLSYCIKCKFMSKYASKFMEKFKDNFKKICPNYSEGVYNQLSIMIEQNLFHKNQIITKIQDDIYAMYYIMDGETQKTDDNPSIMFCVYYFFLYHSKTHNNKKYDHLKILNSVNKGDIMGEIPYYGITEFSIPLIRT